MVANTENLKEMSLHDIELAIRDYYVSIKTMEESYKLPLGQLDDLVAECSFESHPLCDWEYESEIVTWERAEEIVQKFINTDGEVFEEE